MFWRKKVKKVEKEKEPVNDHQHGQSSPLLEVRHVERIFDVGSQRLHVLKGINMELKTGQLVMLKGRSGSGKTTLLNLIGGLDVPTKGEILFRGQPFHQWNDDRRTMTRRKEIGFIFSGLCSYSIAVCLRKCGAFTSYGRRAAL